MIKKGTCLSSHLDSFRYFKPKESILVKWIDIDLNNKVNTMNEVNLGIW